MGYNPQMHVLNPRVGTCTGMEGNVWDIIHMYESSISRSRQDTYGDTHYHKIQASVFPFFLMFILRAAFRHQGYTQWRSGGVVRNRALRVQDQEQDEEEERDAFHPPHFRHAGDAFHPRQIEVRTPCIRVFRLIYFCSNITRLYDISATGLKMWTMAVVVLSLPTWMFISTRYVYQLDFWARLLP